MDETEKIAQIIRTVVRSSTWTSGLEIDVADDIAGKLVPLLQSVSMSVPHIQFLKVTIRGWPTSSEHRAARHDVVSSLVVPSLRVLRLASVSIPWEAVRGLGHLTELYLGQDDESTKGRLDDLLKVLSACASTLVTLQLHHAVEEPEKCQDRVVELRALRNLLLVGGRNADRLLDVLRCHWGAATGGIPRLAFSMNVEGFDSPRLHEVAGNIRNFWARSGAPPMVPGTRELNHWQWHIAENFRGDEHPSPLLYEWYWVHDAQYWLTFCFESGGRAVNALVGTFGLDRQDVQEGDLRTTVADHWWGYGCIRA